VLDCCALPRRPEGNHDSDGAAFSLPKQMDEAPPGTCSTRELLRSVMKLPVFCPPGRA
jgi:hypothetical protein